jgi:pyruvate/2-oxoglutarate/acetoin dehydrogenase E1 component
MPAPVSMSNSEYADALRQAMRLCAAAPRAIFMGQSVAFPGTAMFETLELVPMAQRLELPVTEDMQMGLAIGMALAGALPICIYPRWNFLLLAANQLVLHLDKLPLYSKDGYRPKVIIRTAVATDTPLNPGAQHLGDFTDAFRLMLKTVWVEELLKADDVVPGYEAALRREQSTLLVEHSAR